MTVRFIGLEENRNNSDWLGDHEVKMLYKLKMKKILGNER